MPNQRVKCPLVTQKNIRKYLPFSSNRCADARDKKVEKVLRENDLTGGLINADYVADKLWCEGRPTRTVSFPLASVG